MPNPAQVVAGRVWSGTVRLLRYLAPLLRDTLVYIWRLALDAAGGLRILFLRWQARRTPSRAADYAAHQAAIRESRARRWTSWHGVSGLRRMEVRAATLVLAIVLVGLARYSRDDSAVLDPAPPSSSPAEFNDPAAASLAAAKAAEMEEERKRIARFAVDRQRTVQGEWAALRDIPGIERGRLGAWDGYTVSSPVVLKESSGRHRYRMWFRGCHMAMHEFSCGVGHATSADGIVWQKFPNPVFAPEDPSIQEGLDEIAVVKAGGRYYLWYSVIGDHFNGRHRASVHLATSPDGLVWTDERQVLEGWSDKVPTIAHAALHDGQRFHLWYVAQVENERSPLLQHLSSPDGKTWTVEGETSIQEELNIQNVFRLVVIRNADGGFRAYACDSGLQTLTSLDGTSWTKQASAAGPLDGWRADRVEVHSLTAVQDDDGLWIWMDIRPTPDEMRLGVAVRKGNRS